MSKIPMVFEIELSVEEAKDKIGIREKPHRKACNRSPVANLLIVDSFCNDYACQRMSNTIHKIMITRE